MPSDNGHNSCISVTLMKFGCIATLFARNLENSILKNTCVL